MKGIKNIKSAFQLILLGGTLLLMGNCGGSASVDSDTIKDTMNKTKEAASSAKKDIQSGLEDIKLVSKDAAEQASDLTSNASKTIQEGATKSMETVKETAKKAEKSVSDAAKTVKESAKKSVGTAATSVKETVNKAKDMASDKVKKVATSQPNTSKNTTSSSTTQTSPATKTSSKQNTKTAATQPNTKKSEQKKPAPVGVSHEAFDLLLKKYVSDAGIVDYAGMKGDLSKLNSYTEQLSQNPAKPSWPKNKQLAYWINTYNAFTLKLILDNYPVKSIKDINSGKPWDKSWIKIGDKTYSLNNIENDIIRPTFKEPRIHFAVNCAAKSCPPLHNRAWTANNLEQTLEKMTKKFINDSNFNQINGSKTKISSIFDWYAVDFGDVPTYLNKYSNTKIKANSSIGFLDYNWELNGK